KKIALSAGIVAVPLVVFLIIVTIPATTTYKDAQIGDSSLEFSVETAEKILVGKVVDVEVRQIDQFIEVPDNPEASCLKQDIYQFVTVEATEYVKEETGEHPKQVTFLDDVSGCLDWLEKQCQVHELAIEYEEGENALFILERIEDPTDGPLDGLLTTLGYLQTYKISDGEVQSEFRKAQDEGPKQLADLKSEIKEIMDRQRTTEQERT